MDTLVAYKSKKDYPKDLTPGQIYVDMRKHAVLIPNSATTHIPLNATAPKVEKIRRPSISAAGPT